MRIQLSFAVLFAAVFACAMHAGPAQAQRVFVSGTGSDSNPCTFASPCRSFQHAHDVAPAGGEISVLDSAGYGTVSINKSISIVNPGGVEAGISVSSGNSGITINSPNATDTIILRGLTIDGQRVGLYAINFQSGGRLEILDSVVRNFTNSGIIVQPSTGSMTLLVSKTHVLDNSNAGIYLSPKGSSLITNALVDQTTVSNNTYGIYIDASHTSGGGALTPSVFSLIKNTTVDNNSNTGITLIGGNPGPILVMTRDTAVDNSNPCIALLNSNVLLYLIRTTLIPTINFSSVAINNSGKGDIISLVNNDFVGSVPSGITAQPEQ
jgi:hypothetical protein